MKFILVLASYQTLYACCGSYWAFWYSYSALD